MLLQKDLVNCVDDVYRLSKFECDLEERKNVSYNEKVHIVTLFLSEKMDELIDGITKRTNNDFDFETEMDKVLTKNINRCADRIKRMIKHDKLEKEE
jgi:hypothetical protein